MKFTMMNQVKKFHYHGSLSASKSMMNRALILKSFFPDLNIPGDSLCDDVKFLKKALHHFRKKKSDIIDIDCGQGGTCLRFLLARMSRTPGHYFLKTHPSLLKRPHGELLKALGQMGVQWETRKNQGISMVSRGWKIQGPVTLDLSQSSQYASALLLSAWDLPKPLTLHLSEASHSQSYLNMTLSFLHRMGLEIRKKKELLIPPRQKIKKPTVTMEPDMDSAFVLGALAAASGSLELESFPAQSEQPSFAFIKILKKMGVKTDHDSEQRQLRIKKTSDINAIGISLSDCPDLFPVLAVLLSRAQGLSCLRGLDLLSYKESDRLTKTSELLTKMNFKHEKSQNSMTIQGEPKHNYPPRFDFDPAWDHRMVMAATLAVFQGASINIHRKHTVSKSFPEFLEIPGLC